MEYKPTVGKLKVKLNSKGGSYNADLFRKKYQDSEKAYYDNTEISPISFGLGSGDYKEKQSILSFDLLKRIATSVAPITAIINTRIDQVALFAKPSRYNPDNIGFKVKMRELSQEPTDEELEEMKQIEEFIENCGAVKDRYRDNFETFLRKTLRDSLTIDGLAFEKVLKDNGQPYEILPVDASTIRSANENYEPEEGELETDEEISYVQVIDNKVMAAFTSDELAYAIRNPRTDVDIQPYGLSEIELIVKQLSSYLEAEDYNMRFFQQGGMSKGIINIKEDPNGLTGRDGLESFKRQWRTQVSGQKGAWRIPVFQVPGELEFINIQQSGGEMVFEKWINYLINITCAVYRIDPAEINFPNNGGVGGRGNSLFSGEGDKYRQSQDKGLLPLLQFIENTINQHIISLFSDKYIFVFDGVKDKSEQEQLTIDRDKVSNYITVNELREEKGLSKLKHGDIILNPYFMQSQMSGGMGGDSGGFDFVDDDDDDDSDNDFDSMNQDDDELDNGNQEEPDNQEELDNQEDEGVEDLDDLDKAILSIEVIDDKLLKSVQNPKVAIKKL